MSIAGMKAIDLSELHFLSCSHFYKICNIQKINRCRLKVISIYKYIL